MRLQDNGRRQNRRPSFVTPLYNVTMARGWESKSVEDQIAERQTTSPATNGKKAPSPLELKNRARRQSLLLARTRTLTALEATRDAGYRTMLERALHDLDSELSGL
jgi:hypothetical protein